MNKAKQKKLLIMVIVLIVLCIVAFAVSRIETKNAQVKSGEKDIMNIVETDVSAISWKVGSTEYSFTYDADNSKWVLEGNENFPVSTTAISDLLEYFAPLTTDFTIEDADDLSSYGLDNPELTVTITEGDTTHKLSLGDFSKMDQERYISIGDGKVYLAQVDPYDAFNIDLTSLIENDKVPTFDKVEAISINSESSDYDIVYDEENTTSMNTSDVYFAETSSGTLALDTDNIDSYIYTLESLDLSNYVTYEADSSNLKDYFLDAPALKLAIKWVNEDSEDGEQSFTLTLGIDKDAVEAQDKKGEDADYSAVPVYLRVGESSIIYQISYDEYGALMSCTEDDFRHQNIFYGDFEDVESIDITVDGESYTLTREAEADDDNQYGKWSLDGEDITIDNLASALTSITVLEFTDKADTGKEEISFTINMANENIGAIKYVIKRIDGSSCALLQDGKLISTLERSDAMTIVEAVNSIILN